MRFFAVTTLLALFLIQSQTAHANFLCNDGNYPNDKTGYCLMVNPRNNDQYYAVPADALNTAQVTFSCDKKLVFTRPATSQACCYKPPQPLPYSYTPGKSRPTTFYYTAAEVRSNCYSR